MKYEFTKKYWMEIVLLGIIFTVFLVAFAPALFSGKTLYPPVDGRGNYRPDNQQVVWESLMGGWTESCLGASSVPAPLYPSKLLAVVLPPLAYHLLGYMFDVLLLFLAGLYYLRGRKIGRISAVSGALALGFMGYSFSLISAGHRGVFDMLPFAVFLFGLIDRAIGRGSLIYYALIGVCVSFGLSAQPDIMVMFLGLSAVYAIYRFINLVKLKELSLGRSSLRVVFGAFVCFLFFGLFSIATVMQIRDVVLPGRTAQIESSVQSHSAESKVDLKKKRDAAWEFATNWSLPPEEIAEFAAPCIYGIESGDRNGPYWGRLGRTLGWGKHHKGLMNLRQHTVYMGAIQISFAFFALFWFFGTRHDESAGEGDGDDNISRGDIIFWSVIFVVTLLLALGRYFPLYRLFYALPVCSKIRAPVKFLHLSGMSLAFVFAFGVDLFLKIIGGRAAGERSKAKMLLYAGSTAAVLSILFLLASMIASDRTALLAKYLQGMRLSSFAPLLTSRMTAALAHAGILFGAAAALLLAGRRYAGSIWFYRLAIVVFLLVVPMDLALVGRHYVRVRDVTQIYKSNPIQKWLKKDNLPVERLSYYISQRTGADWRYANLYCNGIWILEPDANSIPDKDIRMYFTALAGNMPRLWQLTGTPYILGYTQELSPLMKNSAFSRVTYITLAGGIYRDAGSRKAEAVLVKFHGALPRALFFHSWRVMPQEDMLKVLSNARWNPASQVLVAGDKAGSCGRGGVSEAEIEYYSRRRVVVKGTLATDGILLLNDRYDSKWKVTVDGKEAELLRCNYLMRGVKVPAGRHVVEFRFQTEPLPVMLSMLGIIVLLAWGGWSVMKRRNHAKIGG